jgi:hypothetical protein
MAKYFERYTCPDFIVTGVQPTIDVLEDRLGIPPGTSVRPTKHGSGFDAAYFQVNEDLNLTASGIQMLGVRPLTAQEHGDALGRRLRAMLLAYITSQPMYRPNISHVTALGTGSQGEVDEIIEILTSRNVAHIACINNVYIGLVEDNGRIYYDPAVDGNTLLEFANSVGDFPGLTVPPVMPAQPQEVQLPEGTLVRPLARVQLVQSAAATIDRLRAICDFPDDDQLEYVDGDGYRSIVIKPNHPLSAVWELLEPAGGDSRSGQALANYGPGVWTVRLGVSGLGAKLDDLNRRGTRWQYVESSPEGQKRVAVSRYDLRGLTIELEELPIVHRGTGSHVVIHMENTG